MSRNRLPLLAALTLLAPWAVAIPLPALADEAATPANAEPVTFNRDVAPIVLANCAACHRPGEVAPFSLLTYDQVHKRGQLIAELTSNRTMPPWKSHAEDGPFIGQRRLTDGQVATIARWVEQGMAEGDADDLPAPPQFSEGWKLGQPDLVLTMPQAYELPAEGNDVYRNFVLPLAVPEGKFIKALEYRPGNRAVVHHVVFLADDSERLRQRDAEDDAPGFTGEINIGRNMLPGELAIWVPGRDPLPLQDGFSYPWPANASLLMQLHLHPSGKPETEQSSVGVYLCDDPPVRSMLDLTLLDTKIDIPPGEREYRTRNEYTLPADVEVYGIFPHMHLLGRDIRVTAHPPEGDPLSLLRIDDWDFNWQSSYQYVQPVRLAAGTRLVLEGIHDNSADNFRNPFNPPRRITWGEQTTNEMSLAFLQVVPVDEASLPVLAQNRLRVGIRAGGEPNPTVAIKLPSAAELFKKFDRDGDGLLSLEEVALANRKTTEEMEPQVRRFDSDKDGAISLSELEEALRVLGKR
ncbi:MAG: EF-hand domain-containing protein [Pirellulales bacterium]